LSETLSEETYDFVLKFLLLQIDWFLKMEYLLVLRGKLLLHSINILLYIHFPVKLQIELMLFFYEILFMMLRWPETILQKIF